jgi:hypothetical protein
MAVRFRLGLMVKSVVSVLSPLSAFSFTYRSQYLRITLNYVTLSFFFFSFLHCFAQGILQSFLYTADDTWGSLTSHIVAHAHTSPTVFSLFTGRHGNYSLELCDQVPVGGGGGPPPCVPFFTAGQLDPITIPSHYVPHRDHAPDPDASFVRQPFISFTSVLLILFWGAGSQPFWSIECREFLSGNRCYPSPLTFVQTSSTWLLDLDSIHIDALTRSDGLSDVTVTSNDGRMSLTLNPVCTYTLLYPAAV